MGVGVERSPLERIFSFVGVAGIIILCAQFAAPLDSTRRSVSTLQRVQPPEPKGITEEEVHVVLGNWATGIVEIGRTKLIGGDYRRVAAKFVDRLYAYGVYPVLFKPSRAEQRPFRPTREGALAYFIGGNPGFPEDVGFALEPWSLVTMDTKSVSIHNDGAVAMGVYHFVDTDGAETPAEFTFGLRYDDHENLRIILHHSSLPFGHVRGKKRTPARKTVTEQEVWDAIQAWGDSIVEIGKVKMDGGDFVAKASQVIDRLYGYDVYPVMFKPTNAAQEPFRDTHEGALSYFVGGNPSFPEDRGFAINPWIGVRFDDMRISLHESSAIAMGVYYFYDMGGEQTQAEFSFGYRHDAKGRLRIVLHHSSLPYAGMPSAAASPEPIYAVTHDAVVDALKEWGNRLVEIGNIYRANGNYRLAAAEMVDSLYGYEHYPVLFKPTTAAEHQFRSTREGALSYFVAGNANFPEDTGFAITPWSKVSFTAMQVSTSESSATAMGSYQFTDMSGKVTEAECTMGFRVDPESDSKLRIVLHHSSLPYKAAKAVIRHADVTEEEVVRTLKEWAEGIIEIGEAYVKGGDYEGEAAEFVDRLYGYDVYPVLFKPTKAAWHPFRPTRAGAISYFIGGDFNFPEDNGFALAPYKEIRFNTTEISVHESTALAMGTKHLVDAKGQETQAEFTLGFRHDDQGTLRIVLHHSSLPYGA